MLTTADSESHDLNENDTEDDVDKEVPANGGWCGDSAVEAAGKTEASVNTAHVHVRYHCVLLQVVSSHQ